MTVIPEIQLECSSDQACSRMLIVLDSLANPVQASVFLISLCFKRKPKMKINVYCRLILNRTKIIEAEVNELVEIADTYNDYARSLPSSPFLIAQLAKSANS